MNPGIQIARFLTQSPIRGALLGAGIGGVAAKLRGNEDGKGSILRGALRGAAVGAVGSGLGRAYRDVRLLNPGMGAAAAVPATLARAGKGVANFAKRQVHGLTGALDADAIGMHGVATSKRKVDLLNRRLADDIAVNPTKAQALRIAHQAAVQSELRTGTLAQQSRDAGLGTIPGIAKAMWNPGQRSQALRAVGRSVTSGGGTGGLAIGVGLPVAMAAPSLMKGDESATGGASMRQKMLGLGGSIGATALTSGLPIVPQLLAAGALDHGVRKLTQPRSQT